MLHAFTKTWNSYNITWSQLNHPPLLWKRSTVCTRQELGRKHIIQQCVTLTLDVNQVCHCQLLCQKWELFLSSIEWKSMDGIAGISCYLNKMLDAIITSFITIFVFQQDSAPIASYIQHSPTAAVQNSQYGQSYGFELCAITVQSLTPLTVRFRESYGSVSMSCK